MEAQLAERDQMNNTLQASLHAKGVELENAQKVLSDSNEQTKVISEVCENQKADIAELQSQVQRTQEELTTKTADFEQSIVTLKLTISDGEQKISALEQEVNEKKTAVALIESNLAKSELEIDEKGRLLAELEAANIEIREKAVKVEESLTDQMKEMKTQVGSFHTDTSTTFCVGSLRISLEL